MYYQITNRDGVETVSLVLSDGYVASVPATDPNYRPLVAELRADSGDEAKVRILCTPGAAIAEAIKISDRIEMRDNKIYFDGERVKGKIAKHLRRMATQEDPKLHSLVSFLTKLKSNPSIASQGALYRWLADREFTITEDGDIIGYKGLSATGTSIHSGIAWVNGVKVEGHIPNPVGAVVTMERDMVNPDRFASCSYGLHVGTWDYASSFGNGMTVTVQVNPADVVMVPDDCDGQKMRVCRYKVIGSAVQECKLPVFHDPDAVYPRFTDESAPSLDYDGDYDEDIDDSALGPF